MRMLSSLLLLCLVGCTGSVSRSRVQAYDKWTTPLLAEAIENDSEFSDIDKERLRNSMKEYRLYIYGDE